MAGSARLDGSWQAHRVIEEAKRLGSGLSKQASAAYTDLYRVLVEEIGCDAYVKTIYVGFVIGGEMVAAIYPRSDHLEVALALPEDIDGREFKDATHLTWPTMPVSVEVRTKPDLAGAVAHVHNAAGRVRVGEHDVRRPNEHFMGRERWGKSRR